MEPRELQPKEFNSRLLPLILEMLTETPVAGGVEVDYFFPHWRYLLEIGTARTWELEHAVLGAVFVPNTFSGKRIAMVSFLFVSKEFRGLGLAGKLMRAFEAAAISEDCVAIFSATHLVNPEKLARSYCQHGYAPIETTFRKVLRP